MSLPFRKKKYNAKTALENYEDRSLEVQLQNAKFRDGLGMATEGKQTLIDNDKALKRRALRFRKGMKDITKSDVPSSPDEH